MKLAWPGRRKTGLSRIVHIGGDGGHRSGQAEHHLPFKIRGLLAREFAPVITVVSVQSNDGSIASKAEDMAQRNYPMRASVSASVVFAHPKFRGRCCLLGLAAAAAPIDI